MSHCQSNVNLTVTVQKMKFSIKDFFSKCYIWSHLLKMFLMEIFIFCVVYQPHINFLSDKRAKTVI